MTEEQIREMKPGRELDALVAREVMGWEIHEEDENGPVYKEAPHSFRMGFYPSTDITDAWEVVEKMQEKVYTFYVERPYDLAEMKWMAYFSDLDDRWMVYGWTAPEVICKCALLALMEG